MNAFCGGMQVLLEVSRSLQYIHSLGLIHCDIKPENVSNTVCQAMQYLLPKSYIPPAASLALKLMASDKAIGIGVSDGTRP
jgi:hypothetical protein